MQLDVSRDEPLRTWQEVAKERGISLRVLGDLTGKTYNTMLAYSMGRRVPPQEFVLKLSKVFGERVR